MQSKLQQNVLNTVFSALCLCFLTLTQVACGGGGPECTSSSQCPSAHQCLYNKCVPTHVFDAGPDLSDTTQDLWGPDGTQDTAIDLLTQDPGSETKQEDVMADVGDLTDQTPPQDTQPDVFLDLTDSTQDLTLPDTVNPDSGDVEPNDASQDLSPPLDTSTDVAVGDTTSQDTIVSAPDTASDSLQDAISDSSGDAGSTIPPDGPIAGPSPASCTDHEDCPSLQVCDVSGQCASASICIVNNDCTDGYCVLGTCVPIPSPCTEGSLCPTGGICHNLLHTCVDANQCGLDVECVTGICDLNTNTCVECAQNADCPVERPSCLEGTCVNPNGCSNNGQCAPAESCIQGNCAVQIPNEDAFENNDSFGNASPLSEGTHNGLTIHPIDPDHYAIEVPANQSVVIRYLALSSKATLHGALFEADSEFILDSRRSTSSFGTLYAAARPVSHNVVLQLTNPYGTAINYQLIVQFTQATACLPDRGDAVYYNNNSLENAEQIFARFWTLTGRSICGADEDWFRVDVEPGDDLIAWFSSAPGESAPLFSLRDSSGAIIENPEIVNNHQTLHGVELPPGTYYLSVEPANEAMDTRYQLQVKRWSSEDCSPDMHEVDDLPELAAAKTILPPIFTICGDDKDYIAVSNEPDKGLNITLEYNNFFGVLKMTVIDADSGTILNEVEGTSSPLDDEQQLFAQIPPTPTSVERYLLVERVSGNQDVQQIWYTMDVASLVTSCLDDTMEDNDSWPTASSVPIFGSSVQAIALSYCSNDVADWFQGDLEPEDTITVDIIKETSAPATFNLELHKPTGTGLISNQPQVVEPLGTSLTQSLTSAHPAGSYLWKVTADQSAPYRLYAVRVRAQDCAFSPEEPDNTPLTARLLEPNSSLEGALCVNNPDVIRVNFDGETAPLISVSGTSDLIVKVGVSVLDTQMTTVFSTILQGVGAAEFALDLDALQIPAGTYFIVLQPLLSSDYELSR